MYVLPDTIPGLLYTWDRAEPGLDVHGWAERAASLMRKMLPPEGGPVAPSVAMTCPRCHHGGFLLKPDGRILCAEDDCHAEYGWWYRPGGAVR